VARTVQIHSADIELVCESKGDRALRRLDEETDTGLAQVCYFRSSAFGTIGRAHLVELARVHVQNRGRACTTTRRVGVSILGALANVTSAVRHIGRRARQSGGAGRCKHFGRACQCDERRSSHWQACSTIRRRGWV
jgi:hypothetical protein